MAPDPPHIPISVPHMAPRYPISVLCIHSTYQCRIALSVPAQCACIAYVSTGYHVTHRSTIGEPTRDGGAF
eukprot:445585-Rhodomonas_salina.1